MTRASKARFLSLAASLMLVTWVGCKSSGSKDMEEPEPVPTGSEFDQGSMSQGSQPAARPELRTIYFDFDRAEIRADARPVLRDNAEAIKANQNWGVVTIEGHCDERGSEEYNLALGERRASAVRRYMVDLGVPSNRLRTVSFGEARPAVPGHDESAWRYNRRSEFSSGT